MKLFGPGFATMLSAYFDRKVTFQEPVTTQDEYGELHPTQWNDVDGYTDLECCVGDRMIKSQANLGAKEPNTVILLPGAYTGIQQEWRAIIDGDLSRPYRLEERTPNQSDDVTEVPVSRWE